MSDHIEWWLAGTFFCWVYHVSFLAFISHLSQICTRHFVYSRIVKKNWRPKNKHYFFTLKIMHNNVSNFSSGISFVLFRFWAISIVAQNGWVSGYFCSSWRMIWGRQGRASHIVASWLMFVVNIEVDRSLSRVLGDLCYRSLPLCSLYHTSQRAADLVFWARNENATKAGKA